MSGEVPSNVPPAAFGRFRVLHQIGVGSLGPVFRGAGRETREAVAIKQLRLNLSPEQADQVIHALRALIDRLPDHPGLLRLIDAGLHQGDPYIVTALATGESLDAALREYGPAAIADALPRLQRLADALDRAAAKSVWHGALQPSDILVSGQQTQIAGIGIVPALEKTGVRRPAKRPYGAPEIVDGGPTSSASDQYALAAIAYEWLFGGRAPRSAESVLDAPALHGVKAETLASALMTGLAANPADRFANCTRFVEALRAAVTDQAAASSVGDKHGSVPPLTAPLALEFSEEGADALFPAEGAEDIDEVASPALVDNDLHLDPQSPPLPLTPPPEPEPEVVPARHQPERVAWQGSLGASTEPTRDAGRGAFGAGTLVAALVGGIVLGGVGGYLLGASRATRVAPATPLVTADQPTPATKPPTPGRDFTDAPLAGAESAPAKEPPSITPPPAATPEGARLLVRSSPAGATVVVDGAPRGTTPLTLRDLALGTRTVVVSRPGYDPIERSITLTADRPSRSVEVQLTPAAAPARASREPRTLATPTRTATLVVDSRPSGASVTIDGEPSGATPLTVASITPGSHTVRIERVGYRPVTQTIEIKAGERRRVAVSLEAGQDEE